MHEFCDYQLVEKERSGGRPKAPAWNSGDTFGAGAGLALLLSGLTYDHSSFEARAGSVWLAAVAARRTLSTVIHRRRLGKWRKATACDPVA